jgi:type IV secretory pathway VirB2 component (pilin)
VIAMAATGGMLVFGGELTEVTRKSCILVLAIAFLVGGAALMKTLFNVSAALI